MSSNTRENLSEMPADSDVLLSKDATLDNASVNVDNSNTPRPKRPTNLPIRSKHDSQENDHDESLADESINTEETKLPRSSSNIEGSHKFNLRDISPSRLRERHKAHARKKSDQGSKLSVATRKNVRPSSSSWLPASFQQMFPSYKSKSSDFKRLFKNVPESEKLITDYSCALQRDILVHGRLYVSQSWLCFHANIFGWETLVTINLKQVASLTKEKTALVIPNAIQVWTESEKYFFASFVSRDSTYRSISLVWKNVLSDEPDCVRVLMSAVGKYTDVDSEDVENSSRGSNDEIPFDDVVEDNDSLPDSDEQNSGDKPLEDQEAVHSNIPDISVSPASPKQVKAEEIVEKTPKITNGSLPRKNGNETRRRFPFPFKKEFSPLMRRKEQRANKNHGSSEQVDFQNGDSLIEDGSVSESNDDEGPVLCPCESHLSIECHNEQYAVSLDTLYEYLFTDCDFFRNFRQATDHYDFDIDPWVEEDDKKKRVVKYSANLSLAIGPKTCSVQENQQLEASEPGQYYVVETNVVNSGVPYADSFIVVHRYCLSKVNEFECRLRITAAVKFIKPIWGFVKTMITKNTTEALATFCKKLDKYVKKVENEFVINPGKDKTPTVEPNKPSPVADEEPGDTTHVSTDKPGFFSSFANHLWRDNNLFLGVFIALLFVLILLNIYLSYRVIALEHSTKSWEAIDLIPSSNDLPTSVDEFRSLLSKHQYIQNIQFKRWHHILSTSTQFLQQVQDSLVELQKEVEKPLNT